MSVSMQWLYETFHKNLAKKYPLGDKPKRWSKTVFTILAEMSIKKDMCCWVSPGRIKDKKLKKKVEKRNDGYLQEYMVDMCWTTNNLRTKEHKRIEVAVECEWQRDFEELVWDFSKLLDINSPKKIFISDISGKEEKKKKLENYFLRLIKSYDLKRRFTEDQILFIDINKNLIRYTIFEINNSRVDIKRNQLSW